MQITSACTFFTSLEYYVVVGNATVVLLRCIVLGWRVSVALTWREVLSNSSY